MAHRSLKRFLSEICSSRNMGEKQEFCKKSVYGVVKRCQSQLSRPDDGDGSGRKEAKDGAQASSSSSLANVVKKNPDDEDLSESRWKVELAWVTKALEPALQLYKWALPTGNVGVNKATPTSRSLAEIIATIQRSKTGIEDWSLSDLTVGLYLIYLRQASANPFEDVKGVQISSDPIVQDLIYYSELARGAYKGSAAVLARNSMLRESNIVKFVKDSDVMRPGYYIGIDFRKKLVILGIRGTHTVYDLITDIVATSDQEVLFEGYASHFGIAEAARWFLTHEMGTIKKYLDKYEGFRLRLVGHSLGGAIASLLATMLRKKSAKELGFSPDIVAAIGYATPPCVSRELAESCSEYVSTVVMQDDIIPRLSAASLARLRNEILQTDWMSVVEKEDWKRVIDLVTNAKQVVSSVQDVARKLADYAKFRSNKYLSDTCISEEPPAITAPSTSKPVMKNDAACTVPEELYVPGTDTCISEEPPAITAPSTSKQVMKNDAACAVPEELYVPGTVYYLKRNEDTQGDISSKNKEFFTLWKRHPGEHFQRIVFGRNIISDHKCVNHYYALRDVLKGLSGSNNESIFR